MSVASASGVRRLVADRMRTALSAESAGVWRVMDHEGKVGRINAREAVLQVVRSRVTPSPRLGADLDHTLWLRVLVGVQEPGERDDALDARLDLVLAAIDGDPLLTWSEAEAGTYDETFPSYVVTVTTSTA